MNGIENIENRIIDEARARAAEIITHGEREAEKISQEAKLKTTYEITSQGERTVLKLQDIALKSQQADKMERRKCIAKAKQEIIEEVFQRAQEELLRLPSEKYFNLLLKLSEDAVNDSLGGELLFNKKDRALYGERVVAALNSDILSGKLQWAKKAVSSAIDEVLNGNVPSVSKIAGDYKTEGAGRLVFLAEDTANILGGVVVRRGKIELNCDIGVTVRILSEEMAAEVSEKLFPKGA